MPAKYNVRPFWPANPWDFITTNYGVEQDGTSGKPVLFSRKRFIVRYNEEPPIALEKIEGVGSDGFLWGRCKCPINRN